MRKIDAFAKATNIITVGMQSMEETKKVIEFNKKADNLFEIHFESLIDSKCLLEYIINGYVVTTTSLSTNDSTRIVLKHKDLLEQEEAEIDEYWERYKLEQKEEDK